MASRGDPSKVDIFSNDLFMDDRVADDDENMYNMVTEIKHSTLVYSFGKAVGAKKGWWLNSKAI